MSINPNYQTFATFDKSAYPRLWDGVVGAWCPSLGPSGARLHDVSGRGNWGTLTNMDAATDWLVNSGRYELDVDGTNDYVDMGRALAIEVPLLTFSMWCRPRTTNQAPFSTIAGKAWTTTHTSPFFSYKFGSNFSGNASGPYSLEVNISGTLRVITATFGPSAGRLDFLCGTFDGTTLRFYINGVLNGSASFTGTVSYNNGSFKIGANANNAELFNGAVDDLMVHNRPLSPNEVYERYLLGRGGMYAPRRRVKYSRIAPESQMWIKNSGIWKQATVWIKVAGVWKVATPFIKQGGVWK